MVSKATLPKGEAEEEPEELSEDAAAEAAEHAEHAAWKPSANPWLIACSVMTATFMVVLDSSVANVALPHIAGNLSASTDEATWVLTSYLVANAIMLPATGWITRRIGRKRLLLMSIGLFTVASMLCGMAINMPMLIVARILQGVGGGGMQPLAQAILLESFPHKDHGKAMAVYGTGIVVAPVIGPTLGGWITDSYSWRWIFYINLPVGLLALMLANTFVEDPPYLHRKFAGKLDAVGFGVMALWLGTLQLVLDKGQEADWFDAAWIRWTFAVSMIAFVLFIVHELRARDPLVRLQVLLNRNFAIGTLLTGIYGFVLYSATAMLPLFLQTLMGYPALDSGLAVSPRGMGSMASMVIAGALANKIDRRLLMMFGFVVLGISGLMFARINLDVSMSTVVLPNVLNGFSGGFIFVPLTTMAMGHLRKQEIGDATGIYNLVRNIGGSVGIATATAMLVRKGQVHQSYLAANLTGTDSTTTGMIQGLQSKLLFAGSDAVTALHMAMGSVYRMLGEQASLLAYVDIFRLIGFLSLLCIPIVLLFEGVKHHSGGHSEAPH
ncbi:MAG: DHA2 family efflux MFS transporter permease subunit [Acidobacteriaceae bacterium]|nr:DHA2 family efflux MFS transporter permease subunit [Acidobacteriaceae bacterium]